MATGDTPFYFWRAWLVAGPCALILSLVVVWLDRHEREPWRLLLIAFVWGALGTRALYWPARELLEDLQRAKVNEQVRAYMGQYSREHQAEIPKDVVWGVVQETLTAVGGGQLPNAHVEEQVQQFMRKYVREHQADVPTDAVWGVVQATLKASGAGTLGPLLEELCKAVILFLLFLLLPHEFDGVLDGLIYGALIGLGFAMVENVHYLYRHQVAPAGDLTADQAFWSTIRSRILFHGITGHAMYTGLTGAGLGLARTARREWLHWSAPPLGFALAVTTHIMWNTLSVPAWWGDLDVASDPLVVEALSNLTRLVLISGPLAVVFVGTLVLTWRREQKALGGFLPAEGVTIYTTPEIMRRRRSRWRALCRAWRERGLAGWRAAAHLQRVLIEWAFLRWHSAEGHLAEGVDVHELEQEYHQLAVSLAQSLGG